MLYVIFVVLLLSLLFCFSFIKPELSLCHLILHQRSFPSQTLQTLIIVGGGGPGGGGCSCGHEFCSGCVVGGH